MKQPLPRVMSRGALVDTVVESLRQAILTGHFEPGEKLDQYLIAKELEVSRTPVREAMRVLESEGFIEVRSHYGAFINAPSRKDIAEIYEIRQLLVPEIVRQVTPLIPEPVLDDLEQRLQQTYREVQAGDLSHHFANDTYFEDTLIGYARNDLLKEVVAGLQNRITMARYVALLQPSPNLTSSIQEHEAILNAIRERNPEKAADLMRVHLERSRDRILATVRPPARSQP